MLAFIAGSRNTVNIVKGSDVVALPLILCNDDGSVLDLSTGTVDVLVYDRSDRANAATATHAATVVTAAQGICTLTIQDTVLTYPVGQYTLFVRHTNATSKLYWTEGFALNVA